MTFVVDSAPAQAANWTIDRATPHAMQSLNLDGVEAARVDEERAHGAGEVLRNNPLVGYQREQSFDAVGGGTAEDFLWVGYTFDFSFRRGLFEDAGERRADGARFEVEERRREMRARFESLYFDTLAASERWHAEKAWAARLTELVALLRARVTAGDASEFEVLRVERELVHADHGVDDAHIELARRRAALSVWLDEDPESLVIDDELRPPPPPSVPPSAAALHARAQMEEIGALDLETRAQDRWFVPPVTTTAGGKTMFAPQSSQLGYLFTAQVPLPVIERNQHRRAALSSQKRIASINAEISKREETAKLAAARTAWTEALRALDVHEAREAERTTNLVDTARKAYTGGELSLFAMLEAERTVLEDDLVHIELELNARLAQVWHDALIEEVAP